MPDDRIPAIVRVILGVKPDRKTASKSIYQNLKILYRIDVSYVLANLNSSNF